MKRHPKKRNKMKQHPTAQYPTEAHTNIFSQLTEHAKQIEQHWTTIFQGICDASEDHPHLDINHFNTLNDKFTAALDRLHSDLQSPTLILATTGTTSSGKSTIVNLLCGADLMPRMAQEMSAGVVYIHHSPDGKNHLKVHKTEGACWECREWCDLSDAEIRDTLTKVMDRYNKNKNKGINQLAPPEIELTYPLACFNNPELLALSSLPKTTQFKLMDLPGLRNVQDSTNSGVIEKCKDALCLVAYNMEETDETRRLELVDQVLGQVKTMGGSPARMLFVLNRIDVFRKDREWERYQNEHVTKTKSEISNILNKRLSEHSDIAGNLTYSLLSSLPALHAQRIKTGVNDRIYAADELDSHFNSLISEDILSDLPRRTSAWNDNDFNRVSDAVWKNSYGAEFFTTLDKHIQAHFPTLVIPSIVQRFDKEASHAVGEVIATCYAQINSSEEKYKEACAALIRQNAELRQFFDQSKQILLEPFNQLIEGLKKKDLKILLEIVAEDLAETEVFQGITFDKLSPLASWRTELRDNSIGILQGVKQSLDSGRRNFSNTQADKLSEREQQLLSMACDYYGMAIKTNDESRFDEQLENFLSQISEVIFKSLGNQVNQENTRIRATVELIMKYYLDYLQDGIKDIAPEWSLAIGHYVLNGVDMPEINLSSLEAEVETRFKTEYETKYRNKTRPVRKWYSLFLYQHEESYQEAYSQEYQVAYKCLPDSESIYLNSKEQLSQALDLLVEPFYNMIHNYINELTETVVKEQNRVLLDFNTKLEQARQGHQNNHEKVVADWQPLYDQAQQFKDELSQLTDTRNYL